MCLTPQRERLERFPQGESVFLNPYQFLFSGPISLILIKFFDPSPPKQKRPSKCTLRFDGSDFLLCHALPFCIKSVYALTGATTLPLFQLPLASTKQASQTVRKLKVFLPQRLVNIVLSRKINTMAMEAGTLGHRFLRAVGSTDAGERARFVDRLPSFFCHYHLYKDCSGKQTWRVRWVKYRCRA